MRPDGADKFPIPCDLAEATFQDAVVRLGISVPHYTLHVSRNNATYAIELAKRLTSLVAVVNVQLHAEVDGVKWDEWWLECEGKTIWSPGA